MGEAGLRLRDVNPPIQYHSAKVQKIIEITKSKQAKKSCEMLFFFVSLQNIIEKMKADEILNYCVENLSGTVVDKNWGERGIFWENVISYNIT